MNSIIIEENAISHLDDERTHTWLNQKESHIFQQWLISEGARLTAEAGNALVAGSEPELAEAKNLAEEARLMDKLAELMAKMRDPSKHFTTVKLTPKPIEHHIT